MFCFFPKSMACGSKGSLVNLWYQRVWARTAHLYMFTVPSFSATLPVVASVAPGALQNNPLLVFLRLPKAICEAFTSFPPLLLYHLCCIITMIPSLLYRIVITPCNYYYCIVWYYLVHIQYYSWRALLFVFHLRKLKLYFYTALGIVFTNVTSCWA
jgi:hypothetical protein